LQFLDQANTNNYLVIHYFFLETVYLFTTSKTFFSDVRTIVTPFGEQYYSRYFTFILLINACFLFVKISNYQCHAKRTISLEQHEEEFSS
jgi:hypothetical protein